MAGAGRLGSGSRSNPWGLSTRAWAWLLLAVLAIAGHDALAERNFSAEAPAPKSVRLAAALRLDAADARTVGLAALTPETIAAIVADNGSYGRRALRLGTVRDVSGLSGTRTDSLAWHAVADGSAAQWRVTADGARALRIELDVERAPAGATVRFASATQPGLVSERSLPASGSLWSPVLEGDTAIVELYVPGAGASSRIAAGIAAVAHHVVDPAARDIAKSSSGTPASCEVDLACVADRDPALARVASAVSRLTYVSEGYVWACTGTLVNPGDGSFTPYYYTAAHCIGDKDAASSVAVLWFDQASSCGGSSVRDPVQTSGGAELLVVDKALDGALLRLNDSPPEGVVYAGWDSLPATDGSSIAAVHHPEGGPKKVNLGTEVGDSDERFLAATWTSGVTEDGSSGSPLFTPVQSPRADYLLRGTLVGGTSACTAGTPTGYDLYTRFDLMWPKLAPYLSADPIGGNHSGLWSNAAEPGWGLEVSHQQGVVVAALFTYSASGEPLWVIGSALAEKQSGDFEGDLFQTTGPAFDSAPWGKTVARTVGTMRLTFAGGETARLTYSIDGRTVTKDVTRMDMGDGPQPVCSFTTSDRGSATNYQDLWWNPSESGWGLAIAHQGSTLFTVLFSYGDDGRATWLAGPDVERQADGGFSGTLYRASGPAFDTAPWQPASASAAGTMALRFSDGETGTLTYTVDGRSVEKQITRYVTSPSSPACR